MARFYARFDAGVESTLEPPNDYFDQLRVGANSASGAVYRDSLIASRSLLSTDIYADLDSQNIDGTKGIYFPPDSASVGGPFTTDLATYVSWSSAYSSSYEGIKIPTTNRYGSGVVNYSLRPTASVSSSSPLLIGQTVPPDPVGASYATYFSASEAVRATLNAVQHPIFNTPQTPYSRTGQVPERTLYSIWNDPSLNYFAWDDFTPGTPQGVTVVASTSSLGTLPKSSATFKMDNADTHVYYNIYLLEDNGIDSASVRIKWDPQYRADVLGKKSITASLSRRSGSVVVTNLQTLTAETSTIDGYYEWPLPSSSIIATSTYQDGWDFEVTASVRFYDVNITTNSSSAITHYPDSVTATFHTLKVYPMTVWYGATTVDLCNDTATETFYSTGTNLRNSRYMFVNKNNVDWVADGFYTSGSSAPVAGDRIWEFTGGKNINYSGVGQLLSC